MGGILADIIRSAHLPGGDGVGCSADVDGLAVYDELRDAVEDVILNRGPSRQDPRAPHGS